MFIGSTGARSSPELPFRWEPQYPVLNGERQQLGVPHLSCKHEPSTLRSTPSTLRATPSTLCSTPSTLCATSRTLFSTPSTLCGIPSTLC